VQVAQVGAQRGDLGSHRAGVGERAQDEFRRFGHGGLLAQRRKRGVELSQAVGDVAPAVDSVGQVGKARAAGSQDGGDAGLSAGCWSGFSTGC